MTIRVCIINKHKRLCKKTKKNHDFVRKSKMSHNIDAYLREYIINGFAAGTMGRGSEVIDEFTDMWCDDDKDGHKFFLRLMYTPQSIFFPRFKFSSKINR